MKPDKGRELYEALGVDQTASDDEIKAAFRERVKQTHPDTGGNAEEFFRVKTAHMVLSDAAQRHRYDKTGEYEDQTPDGVDQKALELIGQLLNAVVRSNTDLSCMDLVKSITGHFELEIEKIEAKIRALEATRKRAEKLRGKFKRDDGVNMLNRMVEWQIDDLAKDILAGRKVLEPLNRAIEIMSDYSFDAVQQASSSSFIAWTGASSCATAS